ncbi:MAG TPA: hypothetical protein VGB85_18775 [Nannocystis sp.]
MSARATDDEVAAILADPDKRISGELRWADDEDASGQEFLVNVACAAAELFVRGQRCAAAGTLRFALISRGLGRIAALDLAPGDLHVHRWSPGRRDEVVPLTDAASDELAAWRLFCRLTEISHDGVLACAPPTQESLL